MTENALIIFTKNAEAGKVKTRLAATIGNDAALKIFQQLQSLTVSATVQLETDKFVFYSAYIEMCDLWDNRYYNKAIQLGSDLGERMTNAFIYLFRRGYDKIVIIGSDCPALKAEIIRDAFTSLESNDIVIGPAEDGGYYLIGMKQLYAELFTGIEWSTDVVLTDTLEKTKSMSLRVHLLPVLTDVDEEKDLAVLKQIVQ